MPVSINTQSDDKTAEKRQTQPEVALGWTVARQLGININMSGLASFVPETVVSNDELIKEFETSTSSAAVQRAIGAVERRAASTAQSGAEMMTRVGQQILKETGHDPASIDRIICCCDPVDQVAPETATIVQAKLGATCPAFGLSMACTGWICGVDLAARFLSTGEKRILVLAACTAGSKYIFKNLIHRAIFGDAAAGVLIESGGEPQILGWQLWANGNYTEYIFAGLPWSVTPPSVPERYHGAYYLSPMRAVFQEAVDRHTVPILKNLLRRLDLTMEQIDIFLIHQASRPLYEHTVKSLKIPPERVIENFSRYGNTIAAEMPLLLDEGIRSGRIRKGNLVCMTTYGAGFTTGVLVLRY